MKDTPKPIRVLIREFLRETLPLPWFKQLERLWRVWFSKLFTQHTVISHYEKLFIDNHDSVVHAGPFKGLRYVEKARGSNYVLKLIGCYEWVLQDTVRELQQKKIDTIIDIGCAEGYYLIGLGTSHPQAHLVGYDIDDQARVLAQQLYTKNNLTNKIDLRSHCDHQSLQESITDNTLLICDAEGFEQEILDPKLNPTLTTIDTMVIETHERVIPDIVATLSQRFNNTHDIELITFQHADPKEFEFLAQNVKPKDYYEFLRERGEQDQRWMILRKK